MRKIAILQSCYIPWKGVFDMINMVDLFVFLEDVDFTKQDWRTRNKIKSPTGTFWLSVPVKHPIGGAKLFQIELHNNEWQKRHFQSIYLNYKRARYFEKYMWLIEDIYLNHQWKFLSEMNIYITKLISRILSIETDFVNSLDVPAKGAKDDKVISICKHLNATHYLSGPSAKNYISVEKFIDQNVGLSYIIYDYPLYQQMFGGFDHFVSILDVIFNCGESSHKYIFQNKFEIVFDPVTLAQ